MDTYLSLKTMTDIIIFFKWGAEIGHLRFGVVLPLICHAALCSCFSIKLIYRDDRSGSLLNTCFQQQCLFCQSVPKRLFICPMKEATRNAIASGGEKTNQCSSSIMPDRSEDKPSENYSVIIICPCLVFPS